MIQIQSIISIKFIKKSEMRKLHLILILFILSIQLHAQSDVAKLKERVSTAADKIEAKCIAWRRDIHQHPELGKMTRAELDKVMSKRTW